MATTSPRPLNSFRNFQAPRITTENYTGAESGDAPRSFATPSYTLGYSKGEASTNKLTTPALAQAYLRTQGDPNAAQYFASLGYTLEDARAALRREVTGAVSTAEQRVRQATRNTVTANPAGTTTPRATAFQQLDRIATQVPSQAAQAVIQAAAVIRRLDQQARRVNPAYRTLPNGSALVRAATAASRTLTRSRF